MKTKQQKAIELFWSLDRDQTFMAGDYSIIYCSRGFVVLSDEKKTFEIFESIEKAMDTVPEEDLLSNPYLSNPYFDGDDDAFWEEGFAHLIDDKDLYFEELDGLRESGTYNGYPFNMHDSPRWLMVNYELGMKEAEFVFDQWKETVEES